MLFFAAATNTTGSYVADEDIMFGAATSSTQEWVIHASSNNQATNTVTSRGRSATACIRGMISGAPATIDFEADFTSMNSDRFTVNVSNGPTNALTIHYLALGGTDITNAKAGRSRSPRPALWRSRIRVPAGRVHFAHNWPDSGSYRFSLGATDGTNAKMLHYGQISGSATVQSSTSKKPGSYFTGSPRRSAPHGHRVRLLDATGFTLGGGTPDYPAAATRLLPGDRGGQWAAGVDTEGTSAAAKTPRSASPRRAAVVRHERTDPNHLLEHG